MRTRPSSSSTSSVPLAGLHAAHRLDLRAGDRLVVGDDGQGLLGGAWRAAAAPRARRSSARRGRRRSGTASGRPRRPAPRRGPRSAPAARRCAPATSAPSGSALGEVGLAQRPGGGEQQRLDLALGVGRASRHAGRLALAGAQVDVGEGFQLAGLQRAFLDQLQARRERRGDVGGAARPLRRRGPSGATPASGVQRSSSGSRRRRRSRASSSG